MPINWYNITMNTLLALYENITIADTAKTECRPGWSWISDTNRWTGLHLWLVLSGGADIRVEQEEYHLAPGDFFLFDLSRNHYCTHDPRNPLAVYSVYFRAGGDAAHLLFPPGLSPQRKAGDFLLNTMLFERLLQRENAEERVVWFLPILAQFLADTPPDTPAHGAENALVAQVRRDIDSHPEYAFSMDEICRKIGYSKNHFIRLFKSQTGKTPYEYYLDRKIEKAKHLILYSNHSQTDIAALLHFADAGHFVKQFTKRVGVTPRQYRAAPFSARRTE